jgi:hypothetical protein
MRGAITVSPAAAVKIIVPAVGHHFESHSVEWIFAQIFIVTCVQTFNGLIIHPGVLHVVF